MSEKQMTVIQGGDVYHEFVAVGEADEWVSIVVGERCGCHHDCPREGKQAEAMLHIDDIRSLVDVLNDRITTVEAGA